jgi:hypothetical protein
MVRESVGRVMSVGFGSVREVRVGWCGLVRDVLRQDFQPQQRFLTGRYRHG